MLKKLSLIAAVLMCFAFYSCSKKVHPSKTATVIPSKNNSVPSEKVKKNAPTPEPETVVKSDSAEIAKPVEKPKPKPEFPQVISVNDQAASKSVDGRLYYDVMGHRYWKNFKDGKYYLFNKSMYNDPDFNPPKK